MQTTCTVHSLSISERRSYYPFHERLVIHDASSMQRKLDNKRNATTMESSLSQTKKTPSLTVHGVNILNKNNLDSDTVMDRIIQRRKTHNRVERRRRDRLNNLFAELSATLPSLQSNNGSTNKADTLQEAIEYIQIIRYENKRLKQNMSTFASQENDGHASLSSDYSTRSSFSLSPPPTIISKPQPSLPQHFYEHVLSFQ